MPPQTQSLEKYVGCKLSVPAGACGREWALQEFSDESEPLLHPLEAEVKSYDPQKPPKKCFTILFKYDGDEHEKAFNFVREYLIGDPPAESDDEVEAEDPGLETSLALVTFQGGGSQPVNTE